MPNVATRFKHVVFGRPLASERLEHERLDKKTALAVLSSDAISSVAYATDQILFVVAVLGAAALTWVVPISAVIVGLLVLVGLSYRQTIFAYPGGGGSYTVARDNLGVRAGLVAAAALLTDYILTVAVSISGGVAAITSAYAELAPHTVLLCIASISLLMIVNLRGVRESGAAFSVPTYLFIAMMVALIGVGLFRLETGRELATTGATIGVGRIPVARHPMSPVTGFALLYLLLRGFAEGCAAMTGTEAISNGVTAFKAPAPRNAATTLGWMVTILAVFFLGVSFLARHYAVLPTTQQTVLSQLGRHVFGGGLPYYALQYTTFAVLVLAANTAFADFPRLSGILATDRYMPRQLAARGDRLAFSNGIVLLALLAMLLVWLFHGSTNALVPLYAVGVFVCFTLSQAGMVVHWRRTRGPAWRRRAALNGVGAVATAIVAVIQVVTKFTSGGWIVVLLIPAIIWLLDAIHRHYTRFAEEIRFTGQSPITPLHHTVVVPVNGITRATAGALVYATTISSDVRAVYVEVDPRDTARMQHEWERWDIGVELVVIPSPYRSILRPLVRYVDGLRLTTPGELVSVVVPEIVPHRWWEHLLHNKTALYIRTAFLFRPNVVVIAVPFLLAQARSLRMRSASLIAVVACAALMAAACTRGADAVRPAESPAARRLDGTWHASLRLDRLRFSSVPPAIAEASQASGTLALVANDWLDAGDESRRPTHIGTYSIDFGRIGFDPRHRGQMPALIARTRGSDSVEIVLEPDDDVESVWMLGAWTGDSVIGRWSLEPARAGGDATGLFTLTRARKP